MLSAQPRIHPGKWDAQNSLGFCDTHGSTNLGQTTWLSDSQRQKTRTCRIVDAAVPADHGVNLKEIQKKDKYLDLAWELEKKTVDNEIDDNINCNLIWTGNGGFGNKRMSGDHPNYSIVEIGQNTTKSPGDLKWFANTQTLKENHLLLHVWKTLKWLNNNYQSVAIRWVALLHFFHPSLSAITIDRSDRSDPHKFLLVYQHWCVHV